MLSCSRETPEGEALGTTSQALTCGSNVTMRASVAVGGLPANDFSFRPALNADARFVAFASFASNLVPDDTNATFDVFVRDRAAAQTARVSLANGGDQPDGPSASPTLSADGRFVAFASDATNLVAGDTNQTTDVFVRDTVAGTTGRVSVSSTGAQANGPSFAPSLSADGRWVAFHSTATNLVASDTNGTSDIFVFDRATSQLTRVTKSGTQGNGDSWDPAVSGDGRFVAFASHATNLVSGDTNNARDVFVWDRTTAQITRVSVTSSGGQANKASGAPAISSNGNLVAFESDATNLVASDSNSAADVFVRDRSAGQTTRVSVSSAGGQGSGASFAPTMSGDGRFVAFVSEAANLVSGDANGVRDVFLRDRSGSQTSRVSVASDGQSSADQASAAPSLSSGSLAVAFESAASNLVDGGICHTSEIYVRDVASAPPAWKTGVAYVIGNQVTYAPNGFVYQCVQAHTSASDRTPPTTPALWQRPTPCALAPWAPQTMYVIGSVVTFGGQTYRCLQLHNSAIGQEPNVAPAIWQVVP
jgi:Tol biopolymer transport system component